ncbi:hypothetical protein [Thermorudis peleae]|uniref:hypothetical protein n=1 Tax=Thermorudis peleae TaxID=1382356 RepID=UPI00068C89EB|nr:hypothetical protein [Thermorudis peleae]
MARSQIQRLARFVTLCFLLGNLALLPPPAAAQPAPGSPPVSLQPNQPVPPGFQGVLDLIGLGMTLAQACHAAGCGWLQPDPGRAQLITVGLPALVFDVPVAARRENSWFFGALLSRYSVESSSSPADELFVEPYLEGVIKDYFDYGYPNNWPYRRADDPSKLLGARYVLYFEKGRLEITTGSASPLSQDAAVWRTLDYPAKLEEHSLARFASRWHEAPWAITSGLLAKELLTGQLQVGDTTFIPREPAAIPVAGDADGGGVTYAALGRLIGYKPSSAGSTVVQTIDSQGKVGVDPSLGRYLVTTLDIGAPTQHTVASVFWKFFQWQRSQAEVIDVWRLSYIPHWTGELGLEFTLSDDHSWPWLWLVGWPLTEPSWTRAKVAGVERWVLVQCFERRCMTYTPENPLEWRVEFANTGRHYVAWRYGAARAQEEWIFPWWQVYQPAS